MIQPRGLIISNLPDSLDWQIPGRTFCGAAQRKALR